MSGFRHTVAWLAILAVLVITTASVLPGHVHDSDSARACDICHSGHLPCLQASGQIQLSAHTPVVWQRVSESFEGHLDAVSIIRSPRAPPAV